MRARIAALGRAEVARSTRPRVVAAALADRGGAEAASLRLFWRIIARFAGDMGIAFVATRRRDARRRRAAAHRRFPRRRRLPPGLRGQGAGRRRWRARIPTRLVMRADSVLVGMAAIAAAPQRYAIDYAGRAWV